MENEDIKNEIIEAVSDAVVPFEDLSSADIGGYKKIPLAGIIAMGGAFSTLPEAMRTVTQTVVTNGGEKLYRRIDNIPAEMIRCKDGSGIVTGVMHNGKFAQAKLEEVNTITNKVTSTVPYNPQTLFMAAALAEIEMTLRDVQEKVGDILEFLEEDKKAKLRGNLNTLNEIKENYKYNYDNEMVLSNYHNRVLGIKNDAQNDIEFYRVQISGKIKKKSLIPNLHVGINVDDKVKVVKAEFDNYQLAMYIYSFSSLLEVLISRNFKSEFLNNIVSQLENLSFEYLELYTACYNQINSDAESTVEGNILNGVAGAGHFVGNVLNKVPVVNKSGVGKLLTTAGDKLENIHSDKIEKTSKQFREIRNSMIAPFSDSIRKVDALYNRPLNVLMDSEYIYLQSEA
ncbi:MAG: hypothetical protein J1F28_08555 [Oscillospiraceae bacterium]|nr:hypothetical protein [Oscillospiraceae bacterium]